MQQRVIFFAGKDDPISEKGLFYIGGKRIIFYFFVNTIST